MNKTMELNKETANRLWVKQFGKRQKAFDFAGREIAKASYNDRNSNFGWNVDHILPESRGGKTADHNLICCSIKTNDEKADRFPAFKANGKQFEIQRRENHYEIIEKSRKTENQYLDDSVNFYDVAQGLKCWKKCKPDEREVFVAFAKIKLEVSYGETSTINKFREFIKKMFDTSNIYEDRNINYSSFGSTTVVFTIVNYNVSSKEDSEEWLNLCVLLSTYRDYLIKKTAINKLQILCGIFCYENESQMRSAICNDIIANHNMIFNENLMVNELIKINTSANKELVDAQPICRMTMSCRPDFRWYPYNLVFTKLSANLQKRIDN